MITPPKKPYVPVYRRELKAGDAVALIARPLAETLDALSAAFPEMMRPDLANCDGCSKRQEQMNEKLGNVNPLA